MKQFLLALFIPLITFAIGYGIFRASTPRVSIEALTENTSFYDGMNVEIETYVQLTDLDANDWYLGEPFEKKQIFTWVNIENLGSELEPLRLELKENLSKTGNMRAKVIVIGKMTDNCKSDGFSPTCCFGNSISIEASKLTRIAPVEFYNQPNQR